MSLPSSVKYKVELGQGFPAGGGSKSESLALGVRSWGWRVSDPRGDSDKSLQGLEALGGPSYSKTLCS